ncbi:MAG: hypothetical protein JWO58_2383 [Chitinophagaceae bacterium]|nr:hypothetical protein [Chitinophagaceae bacterium]
MNQLYHQRQTNKNDFILLHTIFFITVVTFNHTYYGCTIKKNEDAAACLLFVSESEYPLQLFYKEQSSDLPIPHAELLRWACKPPRTKIEKTDLNYFFRHAVNVYAGASDEENFQADQFIHLKSVLNEVLTNIVVYRIGEIHIRVYILGQTKSGMIAGLQTTVVETT